jgi:hypothetical protein
LTVSSFLFLLPLSCVEQGGAGMNKNRSEVLLRSDKLARSLIVVRFSRGDCKYRARCLSVARFSCDDCK